VAHGGKIISDPNEGALKFRAPNGVVAEITRPGRYRKAQISGARISGLAVAVADVAEAANFYKTVFGFDEASQKTTARELTAGQFRLRLFAPPLEGRRRSQSPEAIGSRSGGAPRDEVAPLAPHVSGEFTARHHHWLISVSNPAACAKAIEQNGGVLVEKAVAPLYRTPDGSLLELATG
jgi:catechol 2,3-dioxygenase-like lactoylglutathione lyase family enzyme